MKKVILSFLAMGTLLFTATSCEKRFDRLDEINNELREDIAMNASAIKALATSVESQIDALAANGLASLEAAQAALSAAVAANVASLDGAIVELQAQIDALTAVDFSYNADNGIVSITMANGDVYVTGDIRGAAGAPGADGLQGAVGATGSNGSNGLNGSVANAGNDGASAYDLWKTISGNENGSLEDFLASLVGEQGEPGSNGNGSSFDATEILASISSLQSAINAIGAHTDVSSINAELATISATLAAEVAQVDNNDIFDATALEAQITALSEQVAALAAALAAAGVDVEDQIISSSTSSQAGGVETLTTAGTFSDWSPATAASTEATIAQTRSKTDVYTTSALVETTVVTYTVQINGVEDVPAKVAPATETSSSVLSAESTRNDVITESQTVPNPAYVAPNGADVWAVTGTYGGGESNSVITYNAAPSDTTVETYVKIGTETYDVAASGNIETLTVVDAPDVAGTETGNTRQVETSSAKIGETRQVSSETVNNPNYVAPTTGFTSFSESISVGTSVFGGAVTFYKTDGSSESLVASAAPPAFVFKVTVTFDVAGTYYLTYFENESHLADNILDPSATPPTTITIVVAEDGSYTQS